MCVWCQCYSTVCLLYLDFAFLIFESIHIEIFSSFVFMLKMLVFNNLLIVSFLLLCYCFYKHNLILCSAKVCVLVFQLEISGHSVNSLFRIIKSFSHLSSWKFESFDYVYAVTPRNVLQFQCLNAHPVSRQEQASVFSGRDIQALKARSYYSNSYGLRWVGSSLWDAPSVSTQKWMAFEYIVFNCRCFWKHN